MVNVSDLSPEYSLKITTKSEDETNGASKQQLMANGTFDFFSRKIKPINGPKIEFSAQKAVTSANIKGTGHLFKM